MELDNSVYSVTPPTLYLNENGPSIFLMGFNEEQVKRVSQVYDTLFTENSITYYYDVKGIDTVTAPWARAVAGMVDFIIVNADTANAVEILIATMEWQKADDVPLVFIAPERTNKGLCKLISNYRLKVYYSFADMEVDVRQEFDLKSA